MAPEAGQHYGQYETLCGVQTLLFNTMKTLQLARVGEDEDDPTTCSGFVKTITKLERRSRAARPAPKGSDACNQALQNVVTTLQSGLKEFGERWSRQWIKPVNRSESLESSFAYSSCFVMNTLDRLDKVADQIFEYRAVFPVLFQGGACSAASRADPKNCESGIVCPSVGFAVPLQRPNPPRGEDPTRGVFHPWRSTPP